MTYPELLDLVRNRIIKLSDTKGISYRQLSLRIGKDHSYIQKVVSGEINPKLDSINEICNAMDINITDFFNDDVNFPIEYQKAKELMRGTSKQKLLAICELLSTK